VDLRELRIFVAGAGGMVGSSLVRRLTSAGYASLIVPTSRKLDLRRQSEVEEFFAHTKPDIVLLAAAKVGGILANDSLRGQFIYENLMVEANVVHAAYKSAVRKLILLGSSCIYPRSCSQPIREEYLMTGPLEPTNEPYAVAKIAGIKLCESYYREYGCNFYSVMPTNLYGPGDNFDLSTSHVIPALIRKFDNAMRSHSHHVELWGTGSARREFMHVDDCADAIAFLMENVEAEDMAKIGTSHINIGTGIDITIAELAQLIAKIFEFKGVISYDQSKPDGTPRKLLDVSRLQDCGWKYSTGLEGGLRETIEWFCKSHSTARGMVGVET
jgi:GDP-L-fucose synthase